MPDETPSFLETIKAGDSVIVSGRTLATAVMKVERTTAKQIILEDGSRWNRNYGRLVGADYYRSPVMTEASPKNLAILARKELETKAEQATYEFWRRRSDIYRKVSNADLETIIALWERLKEASLT